MNYTVPMLPLKQDIETKAVLKNEHILISTLSLQEAKDSSAIENIITTHDELFKSNPIAEQFASLAAKEVFNYATALQDGFKLVKQRELLTANDIQAIQGKIEQNNAGFRTQSGTTLKNEQTGEVIYTPPQTHDEIVCLMSNLEHFINDKRIP